MAFLPAVIVFAFFLGVTAQGVRIRSRRWGYSTLVGFAAAGGLLLTREGPFPTFGLTLLVCTVAIVGAWLTRLLSETIEPSRGPE